MKKAEKIFEKEMRQLGAFQYALRAEGIPRFFGGGAVGKQRRAANKFNGASTPESCDGARVGAYNATPDNECDKKDEIGLDVFAIDPGNEQSGYIVITGGKIEKGEKEDNLQVLTELNRFLMQTRNPTVVIERIESLGMAVGESVFRTCEWVGRFAQAASFWGAQVDYIYRRDEKLCLCGDSRAKDANIRRALIDRYAVFDFRTGRGTKNHPDTLYGFKGDMWSALAVYTTWREIKDGHYQSVRSRKHNEK